MNLGQVYTKRIVADFMASLFNLPRGSHVLDPCFGKGVFINALAERKDILISGYEIDPISFSSYSLKIASPNIKLMNVNFFDAALTNIDGIIMNPPYVRHEEIEALAPIGITKESLRRACHQFKIPGKSNLYIYFVLHSICQLRQGGELIAIFPNSWLKSYNGECLRKAFSTFGSITRMIEVKGNPFEGKPMVEVCILKFVKTVGLPTAHTTIDADAPEITETEAENSNIRFNHDRLTKLSFCASTRRGLTTSCNSIFINPPITDRNLTCPIISSPKDVKGYITDTARTDLLLAISPDSEMTEQAIDFLEKAKSNVLRNKKPKTLLGKIKKGEQWYCLNMQDNAMIIFPYIIRTLPRFIYNNAAHLVRDNFYCINTRFDPYLLIALLNNYFVFFQLEQYGKRYGNGVLKIQKYDLDSILIPSPGLLTPAITSALIDSGRCLAHTGNIGTLDEITNMLTPFYGVADIKTEYHKIFNNRLAYATT